MFTLAGLLALASHGAAFYLGHRRAVNRLARVTISIIEHRAEMRRVIAELFVSDAKLRGS